MADLETNVKNTMCIYHHLYGKYRIIHPASGIPDTKTGKLLAGYCGSCQPNESNNSCQGYHEVLREDGHIIFPSTGAHCFFVGEEGIDNCLVYWAKMHNIPLDEPKQR